MVKREITNPIESKAAAPQSTDAAIFGAIQAADRNAGERIRLISIYEILPDATQPRRGMPSAVRAVWDWQAQSVTAALQKWWDIANIETGLAIDLQKIIANEHDAMPDLAEDVKAPIARSFLELVGLAANIYASGLTNAITIIDDGSGIKRIETGERRWLAFHLLYGITQDEKWIKIPARLVEEFNIWRQASENNSRSPLNAIGKARQFALLLMELLGRDQFHSFNAFENEQQFYAQVADGEVYRVPRGKVDLLLNAMGLQNPVQIRQYRALLRLPPEVWTRADDENWTEYQVRENTVTAVTVSSSKSKPKPLPQMQLVLPGFADPKEFKDFKNHIERLQSYHRGVLTLSAEQVVNELDQLERWIKDQRKGLPK